MARAMTLWCATVRTKTFRERLEAARAGGFSTLTMFPLDFRRFTEAGVRVAEMHALMDDYGVRVTILDPLTQWLPDFRRPPGMSDEDFAFIDFDETAFFRAAEALKVTSINLIESLGQRYPAELAAAHFAGVCDRAADYGWRVHLEFMPIGGIPDLGSAWEIVRLADRPNGGLCFDTWHYYRGTPDHDLLRTVPGEKVFVVQEADAKAEVQGDLYNDLLHHRVAPGDGDFDLTTLNRILAQTGGLTSVGVEIFSDAYDAMTPEEAGERAGRGLRTVLAADRSTL